MNRLVRTWILLLGLLVVLATAPARLQAQGTDLGSIRGNVVDASGAAIPEATVTITDLGTNITRVVKTNGVGEFEANGLKSGSYKVLIEAKGFNTLELTGVVVRTGEPARADGRLEVGRTSDAIVVREQVSLIQTDSPTVSGSLTNAQLKELPRDSRDYTSFLYLSPNITQSADSGGFKFLGAQSYGASFSLDGQRSNGGIFGQPTSSQPSLESIGELTVMSNSFSAEYAGIANIRVSTKRGEATYHGSLFADNKNSALAAWTLTDKLGKASFSPTSVQSSYPTPYFNLNEFGGSFGGPVPKLKNTFFFAAYEKRIFHSPVNIYSSNLPHASLLAGDFSRVNDSAKPAVPASISLTAAEIAQNTVGGLGQQFITIPSRLLNPVVAKMIQTYFPATSTSAPINAANGRLAAFYTNIPGTLDRNLGTIRVDHDFNARDRIYGVYNAQSQEQANSAVVSPYTPLGLTQNSQSNQTLSLSEVHLFGDTVVNEVRAGFNRVPNLRHSNQTMRQFLQNIGMSDADINAYGAVITPETLDTYGHPAVTYSSTYASFGNGGRNTYRPLDQNLLTFGDTLNWNKGKHTVRAGADFVRNQALDGFTSGRGNPRGALTYSGAGTSPLARFLMGMPADTVRYVTLFRPPMDVHNWEMGFFVQDDFRIHPRLTLNIGLRYEIVTPFTENNDLLVNFDPGGKNPNGNKGVFVVPSQSTLQYIDPRFATYGTVTADSIGVPRSLVQTDRLNFAPRVGLAWRFANSMVLRGGYGLFYPTSAAQGIRDPLATNSFQTSLVKNSGTTPLSGWPTPMSGGTQTALSGLISGNWVPFNLRQPRIHQYNVTLERDLGWDTGIRVSYLGTLMQRLISGVDYSMIQPSDTPFGTTTGDGVTACSPDDGDCDYSAADKARMPFPGLSDYLTAFQNFGHGRSHAFQVEVNRRFTSGFTFNVSYTALDQKSTAPDSGNSSLGGTPYNQFDASSDYGMDAFTSRHRLVTYGVFETPFGRGRTYGSQIPRALDWIAGGWQLSWQAFAKSGTGFTPYWLCDNCDPVVPGNLASGSIDATGGFSGTAFRPLVTGNPEVRSGDRLWDPGAFGLMPLGADIFSNPKVAIRNLLTGPSTYGVNFGIRKIFRFSDRARAEFGADIQNLLNHPLLSPGNMEISSLGNFSMQVNPATLKPEIASVTPNPDFGRLISSYTQDGVDSRRTVRLRLRVSF
ncbi:TonB-dependent receptor [uncultured Paludibaculum sp.]|uniref:TonB-dependent receptor n=1 Tax=uncultured Paludibaculum sp. TaxID=1765020 RepID=UPI002AABA2A2|nr:TonB-dependent receptor [uncultured Paludibaculum sp.]